MSLTIQDYLPPAGARVRFRAEYPKGVGKATRLVLVEDLPAICAMNPKAKISVSYAAHAGGQKDRHVTKVYSVCVDLDGISTSENLASAQERFPNAAVVRGNGLTFLYKIPDGMSRSDAAILVYQIGREAAKLIGLTFDVSTLLCLDGSLAKHEGHLFRFPAGWASKRNAQVEFYPPIGSGSLIEDSCGLNYPRLTEATAMSNGGVTADSGVGRRAYSSGGSLAGEHQACADALGIRRRVLAYGGSMSEAVEQAAAATGKTKTQTAALFSRPGYEPNGSCFSALGVRLVVPDSDDVGVVGLESSSRRFQFSRTMSANFGHSLHSFWDAKVGPEVAFAGAMVFPEFERFRKWFEEKFGSAWRQAMWDDVWRCWKKFGERRGLRLVSKRCLVSVRKSLAYGGRSAPAIVEISGFSLRQVKRALKEMLAKKEVAFTGRTRAKVWLLNPCHTEELCGGMEGDGAVVTPRIDLHPLTRAHSVGGVPILWSRDWTKPKGCPPNTCEPPRHEDDGVVNRRENGGVALTIENADHGGVDSSSIHGGNRCGTRQWSPATISAEPSRTSRRSTVSASVAGSTSNGRA